MSKLFKLKKWLTLKDAVSHLAIVFGEDITEADVLRLALDGTLTLSLFLPIAITANRAEMRPFPADTDEFLRASMISRDGGDSCLTVITDETISLEGVVDLSMIGGEKFLIEADYYDKQNVTFERRYGGGGIIVEQDGQLFELTQMYDSETLGKIYETIKDQDHDQMQRDFARMAHVSLISFPKDGLLIVRTDALLELEKSVNGDQEKPEKLLSSVERTSLLTVIAALCDYSKIKYQERGAAAQIARLTEASGTPVSEDAISKALKKIPSALEARMK